MIEGVSRRAFSGSSGTYNVRASELARERRLKTLTATVVFLDETQHCFQLEKRAKGQALLDLVFQHLELIEKDYFGLQYYDNGALSITSNNDSLRWLDPQKPIKKQVKGGNLYFRVKFYVSDPSKVQEEYTRYHLYLQVRQDILQGRLQLSPTTACLLASYTAQSELGDYNPDEHGPGYLSNLQLIPNQTEELEKKIAELHILHKGQTPADAEFNFLDHAKRLDMYGVVLYRAKDSNGKDIQLGVTSLGIVVFQSTIRINSFSWSKIVKLSFKRKQFLVQLRREPSEGYDTLLIFNMVTYRSSKNLWKSCVEHHTFFRLDTPHARPRRFPLTLGSRFTYSGRTECQTVEDGRNRARIDRTFVRTPSKRPFHTTIQASIEDKVVAPTRGARPHDNKVTSLGSREPKKAWGESTTNDDSSEGGFLEIRADDRLTRPFTPSLPPSRAMTYVDEDPPDHEYMNGGSTASTYEVPSSTELRSSQQSPPEEGLVMIRISPDEQGRFGFNVKGGADLNMPILVSRVAPNTPADRSYPKLNEGDQVLLINGVDISGMLHEQVVNLIRSSRDSRCGELTLTVRPNAVYEAHEEEEPPYQYVPDVAMEDRNGALSVSGGDALAQSMFLLEDGLSSGALLAQFEQLYRKNPSMSMNEARRPQNQSKNRYRDISPYDATRVVLTGGATGDYINANYVNMEIPGSGIINRYIACQGPLANTVLDFWQMVLEAQSTLVVMLTTAVERGRTKCCQYWPEVGQTMELGTSLTLTSTSETPDSTDSFVFREFVLRNLETNEERDISHMQYLAWPDHGVPEDSRRFLEFTERVRVARGGMVEPTIVHCSAGIGRTGVLILMETALGLIEANQPVYPLDITRSMRDQRALMIQTPAQYHFVCSSVHQAFSEKFVSPLPEFSR